MPVQQRLGEQHHAGRAVAALECAVGDERLLDGVQRAVMRQALDADDVAAVGLERECGAGGNGFAIDERDAGAAHAARTADLRSLQAELVAQQIGEGLLHRHLAGGVGAVEAELQCEFSDAVSHG